MRLIIFALFLAKIHGKPTFPGVSQEFIELVPPEARALVEGLSDEDKKLLKESAKILDEQKAIAHIKDKSPEFGARIEKLHKSISDRIDGLKHPEAKTFVEKIIASAKDLQRKYVDGDLISVPDLKEKARKSVKQFQDLQVDAKAELNQTFPKLIAFFEDQKFLKAIEIQQHN